MAKPGSFYGLYMLVMYIFRVLPEVKKQKKYWEAVLKQSMDENDLCYLLSMCFSIRNNFIYHLYSLYPGANLKISVSFISAFRLLTCYLERFCIRERIKDETSLRQLYISMIDAVDPGRNTSSYCKYLPNKSREENNINLFVETCRNQFAKIASSHVIREYIKKYIYLYSDFNIYRFMSEEKNQNSYLLTWAGYYINQYPSISPWEFSASASSMLCMLALFSSGFDPGLSVETVKEIESTYFPWICGLSILLHDYLNYHKNILVDNQRENVNFAHYYETLKHFEERIGFFLDSSFEASLKTNCLYFHTAIVKWLFSVFLSDPRTQFGLNRIATQNLIKGRDSLYYKTYTFMPGKCICISIPR